MKKISLLEKGNQQFIRKNVSIVFLIDTLFFTLLLSMCLVTADHIEAHGSEEVKRVAADHTRAAEVIKTKKKNAAAHTIAPKTRKQLLEGMKAGALKQICDNHGLKYTNKGRRDEYIQLLLTNASVPLGPATVAAQNSSKEADEMGEGVRNFAGSGTVTI